MAGWPLARGAVPVSRPASPLAEGAARFHHGPWPVLAALPRKTWPLVKAARLGRQGLAFLHLLLSSLTSSTRLLTLALASPHLPLPVSSETGKPLMSSPRRPSTASHQSTGLQPLDQEFWGHPSMPSSPATGSLQVPCRWGLLTLWYCLEAHPHADDEPMPQAPMAPDEAHGLHQGQKPDQDHQRNDAHPPGSHCPIPWAREARPGHCPVGRGVPILRCGHAWRPGVSGPGHHQFGNQSLLGQVEVLG